MNTDINAWRQRAGDLPIFESLSGLDRALGAHPSAVLSAPPGAGKTTIVPLALFRAAWLRGRKIIMLEPRRLAARAAARRIAAILGEPVGESVGFRVRNETVVGDRTRIEVVTEGVLTRIIQSDPTLEEYGLVIFDEFHERNLHGDVGLALALQAREVSSDLRILVMSATLDVDRIAAHLGNAPVIRSEGRAFPVDIRYYPPTRNQTVDGTVVSATAHALRNNEGDVLVFLPGLSEISRAHNALREIEEMRGVELHDLHSSVPIDKQDAALRRVSGAPRKVVLATTIAETSLTIEGVTVVVDTGLTRVPRYSPRTGLTSLETVRVTRASADQRAGRAGRTAPGVCYRVWQEHDQLTLLDRWLPEIMDADLVPLVLDLAVMGIRNPLELQWLDAPPTAAFSAARETLQQLGALDSSGKATKHGEEMNRLALHPRLAHMILRSRELRFTGLACDIAALLEERDIMRSESAGEDADLRTRVHMLQRRRKSSAQGSVDRAVGVQVEMSALDRVIREADRLRKATQSVKDTTDERATGVPLAFAYPDRIARRRDVSSSRFVLRNGSGAALTKSQALSASEYIVIADLDGRRPESRIWRAAPVDAADLRTYFAEQIETATSLEWDEEVEAVRLVRRERLGAVVLSETASKPVDTVAAAGLLLEKLREGRFAALPWNEAARALQSRVGFLKHHGGDWPDLSDAGISARADDLLLPHLSQALGIADVRRLDMTAILLAAIGYARRAELDELAPSHIVVPTGSRIAVDYSDPDAPMMSVRLQELFGHADTPKVLRGKVPVTVQLLSPAHRPVQVTRDLSGFWKNSYKEVRKEMRGRYPKHHWPEDPMQAEPTRRAKRK